MSTMDAKAKRTHARRSCDLCKVRKTRCELPDLDVLSSSNPLPADKACHRCRVLSLPCVVDDSAKRIGKKKDDSSGQSLAGFKPPAKRRKRDTDAESSTLANTALALRLMQTFDGELDPSLRAGGPSFGAIPDANAFIDQDRTMKFQTRPYELVAAMLTVAYGRTKTTPPKLAFYQDVNLDKLVDSEMRSRLEPGFVKLRTLHSHLDTIASLFKLSVGRPSLSVQLLLATSLYLSSLCLPIDAATQRLRDTLTPYIYALRDAVILQLPQAFPAVQALELLAVHAPFGVLPLDVTTLSSVALARGVVSTAVAISNNLNALNLIRVMTKLGSLHVFVNPDTWTWLSLCAIEAQYRLEDEVLRVPPAFLEARQLAEDCFEREDMEVWRRGVLPGDDTDFIAKLSTCDRLMRLGVVIDFLTRVRDSIEVVLGEPTYDLVSAIDSMFKYSLKQMEKLDERHEVILGLISSPLIPGYKRYRQLKRHSEDSKIIIIGLRAILAVPFLHEGSATVGSSPGLIINNALQKACDPVTIMPHLEDVTKASTRAVWEWGGRRAEISESVVASLPDLLNNFNDHSFDIFPLIDAYCFGVDCAKNLLEVQAWRLSVQPIYRTIVEEAKSPSWLPTMRASAAAMRRVADLTVSGTPGLESIITGCANIVSSMDRVAGERSTHENTDTLINPPDLASVEAFPPMVAGSSSSDPSNQNHLQTQAQAQSQSQSQTQSQSHHQHHSLAQAQSYMPTSDRWMANGNGEDINLQLGAGPGQMPGAAGPIIPSIAGQANTNGTYPPFMIDQILSETFNYAYDLPPGQHAPPPAPNLGDAGTVWPPPQQQQQ